MDVTYKKKLNSNIFNLLFLSLIITFLSACFNNNGEESDLPVYSIEKIIINPPDSFLINMPLKTYAISAAYIQFSENAVWSIEKQSSVSSIIQFNTEEGVENPIIINPADSIGLAKNIIYEISGNNNNYPENRVVQLKFKKTTTDYNSFYKKL